MANKKEEKKDLKKEEKVEKKVVNKDQSKMYSLEELADKFGYTKSQIRLLFSIRGIDKKEKLSIEDAQKIFKDVMI